MDEITVLARQFREEIEQHLHVFYLQHMKLFISQECLGDHHQVPEIYNDATAQVWRNGEWLHMENTSDGILLPIDVFYENTESGEAAV